MPLQDLREMLDAPVLRLPIGGRVYGVEECSAQTWLRLQEVNNRATAAVAADPDAPMDAAGTGMGEDELIRLVLGETYQQMIDGGVRPSELRHAGLTAYYWQLGIEDVAEQYWASAGKAPTAPEPVRSRSTRTTTRAAKSSTGSRTTTTSRKRSPRQSNA